MDLFDNFVMVVILVIQIGTLGLSVFGGCVEDGVIIFEVGSKGAVIDEVVIVGYIDEAMLVMDWRTLL